MSYRRLRRRKATKVQNDENETEKSRRRRPMIVDDSEEYVEEPPKRSTRRKRRVEEEPEEPKRKPRSKKSRKKKSKIVQKPKIDINDIHLDGLEDFLNLYDCDFELPINNVAFQRLKGPLTKLNTMIGMTKVKQEILDMVVYYLLKLPEEFTNIMQKVFDAENNEEDSFIDEDYNSDQEEEVKEHIRNLMLSRIGEALPPIEPYNDRYEVLSEAELEIVNHVNQNLDMLHTIICGSPGTGKSHVAQIIGEIYGALGFLEPDREITKIKASDLVSHHVGETAIKTDEILQSAIGGVLFLDEAYSISGGDSVENGAVFATNAADAFTNYLTTHKHDFVMIVAGYEDELNSRFFSLNKGLRRRFPWKFTVEKYTPDELRQIFEQMATRAGYTFPIPIALDWVASNYQCFPHFGGSMETLLSKVKIAQGRRVIFLPAKSHSEITLEDMNNGLEKYKKHSDYEKSEAERCIIRSYMM